MPERATKGPRQLGAVLEHVAAWEEPRVERARARARALLALGRSARGGVSCGAESRGESAEFGRIEAEWFAWFVERPHGIPFPRAGVTPTCSTYSAVEHASALVAGEDRTHDSGTQLP